MTLARETVELLVQTARIWHFEGSRHGLRDREWMALRFLARANQFSRTPSALASFVGTTRGTASQIVKVLERKGFLVRKPAAEDKRSVILCVTAQGEKFLGHDPINVLVKGFAALGVDRQTSSRDALRQVLDWLDITQQRHHADICRECTFLTENSAEAVTSNACPQFTCRFFRAAIPPEETTLLCATFERGRR
ncbi:MarR family winged helix-turn-helix transcriptional regulator [Bradyrhizobium cenepequi]|uniref:MarR family winged helix-turn-helix transcriptional regulator n=1 Tax=Bradyrhizobium cenepequi TaxID=2821403 RepID=UPI001CE31329|nr:MarR family transcriptional regulator [Bradyrhizobium cenepequi]MCA6112374.1 MarR family transcriptional regulator [Bradyrhizobium cenepequi]